MKQNISMKRYKYVIHWQVLRLPLTVVITDFVNYHDLSGIMIIPIL